MYSLLLLGAICGVTLASTEEGRIVGGHEVNIEDYPHQISLHYYNRHICGGSIINKRYILTAGHCAESFAPFELNVFAGLNNTNDVSYYKKQPNRVMKIIMHPQYEVTDNGAVVNDLAILQLHPSLIADHSIRPITIGTKEPKKGDLLTITGYGVTKESGRISGHLLGVTVPTVSRDYCRDVYNQFGIDINDEAFCAGYPEGQKDSCQGDSGGPVISNGKLIGIVSYGIGCGRPNIPGVYTNVAKYVNWIEKVTGVQCS